MYCSKYNDSIIIAKESQKFYLDRIINNEEMSYIDSDSRMDDIGN